MNIELLKSSISEITDQTAFRLKYVGSRLNPKKLPEFGFYKGDLSDTKWTLKGISKETGDAFYIEIHLDTNHELYDLVVYELVGEENEKHIITDYSYFSKKLHKIMEDMTHLLPPDDIYREWYALTEFYKLEDILTKNWAEEWGMKKKHFSDNGSLLLPISEMEGHDLPETHVLHKMCYTLNFTILAGTWEDEKVFTWDFHSSVVFEHPLMTRLLVALIRHLDKYPCRQCFFELLFPLSVFEDMHIPQDFINILLQHSISYKKHKPNELQSMAFIYDKFEKYQAAIECIKEILEIDPNDSCAQNNLKTFNRNLKQEA